MADLHRFFDIACPYCGEGIEIAVDGSIDRQRYIEDCQVCCRPIALDVAVDAHGGMRVDARRDDEA